MDVYLFNWTNHQDFKNLSTKPIFQQLGPYRFREHPVKVNVTFNGNNATVSFRKKSFYYFDEGASNGSLSDIVTTVNMIAVSASHRARDWGIIKSIVLGVALNVNGEKVHVTKTAAELLFDGYEDGMLNLAIGLNDNETPYDKCGYLYMVSCC